ncbi:DNA-3-methyladenine glycosylase family protein [uncultured Friedmanniella sp.]|uniref:DNA-3-methyladenine glycosylase family protein n=1 Tax=uncultured Friedmanniella sp. TaxID=335381 RepID=UPI0035CA9CEB
MSLSADPQTTSIDVTGPYDLAEVALMGFGHRDERSFDGVMRMAFCLDGDHETQVGVEARQVEASVELTVYGPPGAAVLSGERLADVARQVARVISLDHDGAAFDAVCLADPALARLHAVAPGFRPALFYSPYEAAVWSVLSARRSRTQAIPLRTRLCELYGTPFVLAGQPLSALPTPSQLLAVEALPGLPADRVPRLHAIARAATGRQLGAERLRALDPAEAERELQRLPGIGPFYSSLIVLRAVGHADVLAFEGHARSAVEELYGVDHELTPDELTTLAEGWRPFRTWVMVSARALGGRLAG